MIATVKVVRKGDATPILERIIKSIRGPRAVKIGFPAGKSSGSALEKAFYNEFGTRGGASGGGWGGPIPERPFVRLGAKEAGNKLRPMLPSAAKSILNGSSSMVAVLSMMGILGQGAIQETITSLSSPPNSPVTIALKGSSNPLIDTGAMRGAVSWALDD